MNDLILALVNCDWTDWTTGSCSKTCGGGFQLKRRTKVNSEHGGKDCEGDSFSVETESCNLNKCPGDQRFIFNLTTLVLKIIYHYDQST